MTVVLPQVRETDSTDFKREKKVTRRRSSDKVATSVPSSANKSTGATVSAREPTGPTVAQQKPVRASTTPSERLPAGTIPSEHVHDGTVPGTMPGTSSDTRPQFDDDTVTQRVDALMSRLRSRTSETDTTIPSAGGASDRQTLVGAPTRADLPNTTTAAPPTLAAPEPRADVVAETGHVAGDDDSVDGIVLCALQQM